MKFITLFVISLICNNVFCQITFDTKLKYNIGWERGCSYQFYSEIKKDEEGINSSVLVKNDSRYFNFQDNAIVEFIYKNIEEGTFEVFKTLNNEKLSAKEINQRINWKSGINACNNDTIRWTNIDEIKTLEIHQEWQIDTVKYLLSNRIIGITPIRINEEGKEVNMFYIKLDNEITNKIINQHKVVYVRELNYKFSWNEFNKAKNDISEMLVQKNGKLVLLTDSNNPEYIDNEEVSHLDSMFQKIYLSSNNLKENIKEHSTGISLHQSLFIDKDKNTINTKINGIAPLFSIYDDKNIFRYLKPLYWMINGNSD